MKYRKHSNQLDTLKEWFLNDMREKDYDKETIRNFENFMYRIRSFEIQYTEPKLINEYNYEELIVFLKTLGSSSKESLVSYMNMIKRFFLFCVNQGKMDDSIDFTRTIDYKTLERCVDKRKNKHRYITEKAFKEVVNGLVNDVDKALLMLIFEGVAGKENSEIINLKKEDIDFDNNILNIYLEDNTVKQVSISDELASILERVVETEIMYYGNDYKRVDTLIGSEYVFRPSLRYLALKATVERMENGEYNGRQLDASILSNRLHKILKVWNNLNYVSPNTLYKSGVVNRAIKHLGTEASKQTYSEWVEANEGYSLCVAYKTYSIYNDIVKQMIEEEEEEKKSKEQA